MQTAGKSDRSQASESEGRRPRGWHLHLYCNAMRAHAGAQRAIKVQKQKSRRDREALGRSSQQVGGPFTACFQTDRVACTPHQIKEKFQICCLQIKRSGNCFPSDFQASDFSHGCSDGGVCRSCLQPGCLPGCKDEKEKKKSDKKTREKSWNYWRRTTKGS